MIGCLKFIVQAVVVVLAIIGLKSLVGDEFFNEKINPFKQQPQQQKIQKARQIAPFKDLNASYEIDRTANLLGYKMILAEHKKSGQKLALLDPGITPLLTKKDFRTGEAKKKISDLNEKLKYQYVRLENFHITKEGEFKAMDQNIPYVRFEADTVNLPFSGVSGFVAAARNADGKDIVIASVNEDGKYSQAVAEDFFKKFQ